MAMERFYQTVGSLERQEGSIADVKVVLREDSPSLPAKGAPALYQNGGSHSVLAFPLVN